MRESVLSELNAWGRDLEGFTEKHASDGLAYAESIAGGLQNVGVDQAPADRNVLLIAMDTACCLWIDDRFEASEAGSGAPVDLEALIRAAVKSPTTPEAHGFFLLRSRFATEAANESSYRLWLDTALDTFRSYHEDALISQREPSWSYAEYMQNGECSVVVMHIVTTVSLVYRLDMPSRMNSPQFVRLMRNLCRFARLQNDVVSLNKERAQGTRANAVLLLEESMPPKHALAFVEAEASGYERLLSLDRGALDPQDPFAQIVEVILASTRQFYVVSRDRYSS
jgi:hypothetical protein